MLFNIVPLQHDIQGKCLFIKYHHLVLGGLDFCQTPCLYSPLGEVNNPQKNHKKFHKKYALLRFMNSHNMFALMNLINS